MKVILQTLRHSDVRLSLDLHGELSEDDLFRELPGKFPGPRLFAAASANVVAGVLDDGSSPPPAAANRLAKRVE